MKYVIRFRLPFYFVKHMRLARLKDYEYEYWDNIWMQLFNEGKLARECDRLAWRRLVDKYPTLGKYDGWH